MNPSVDDFAEMFEASVVDRDAFEQTVVKGTITGIEKDMAIVDVGLKTEGRVPLREFGLSADDTLSVGDQIDVFIERVENAQGEAVMEGGRAAHPHVHRVGRPDRPRCHHEGPKCSGTTPKGFVALSAFIRSEFLNWRFVRRFLSRYSTSS